jgi:hypothetical protein
VCVLANEQATERWGVRERERERERATEKWRTREREKAKRRRKKESGQKCVQSLFIGDRETTTPSADE